MVGGSLAHVFRFTAKRCCLRLRSSTRHKRCIPRLTVPVHYPPHPQPRPGMQTSPHPTPLAPAQPPRARSVRYFERPPDHWENHAFPMRKYSLLRDKIAEAYPALGPGAPSSSSAGPSAGLSAGAEREPGARPAVSFLAPEDPPGPCSDPLSAIARLHTREYLERLHWYCDIDMPPVASGGVAAPSPACRAGGRASGAGAGRAPGAGEGADAGPQPMPTAAGPRDAVRPPECRSRKKSRHSPGPPRAPASPATPPTPPARAPASAPTPTQQHWSMAELEVVCTPAVLAVEARDVACTMAACQDALARQQRWGFTIGGGNHHAFPDHGEGYCIFNDVGVCPLASLPL